MTKKSRRELLDAVQPGYQKAGRKEKELILEQFVAATGYNVVALPLAAGVLVWVGMLLSPAAGPLLMSLSTVIVAINAQLLRRAQI